MMSFRRAAIAAALAVLATPALADNVLLNVPLDIRLLNPLAERVYVGCQIGQSPFGEPVINQPYSNYDLPAVHFEVRQLINGRFQGTVQYGITSNNQLDGDIYYRCWVYAGIKQLPDGPTGATRWSVYETHTHEQLTTLQWWTTGRVPRGGAPTGPGGLTGAQPPRPGVTQPTATRIAPRARPN